MQVWLKHDLRLDDHPGFRQASDQGLAVIPAFCLDPRLYVHLQRTPDGIPGEQVYCNIICYAVFLLIFRSI